MATYRKNKDKKKDKDLQINRKLISNNFLLEDFNKLDRKVC